MTPTQMCHRFTLTERKRFPPTYVSPSCECSSHPFLTAKVTQESAQREIREVNKWVWNVRVSHAKYLDTQALRIRVRSQQTGIQ